MEPEGADIKKQVFVSVVVVADVIEVIGVLVRTRSCVHVTLGQYQSL